MKSTERTEAPRPAARLYSLIAVGLTLLAAILGVFSLTKNYDTSIGYYSHEAVLPIVLAVLCAASVIFFAVFAILRFRGHETAYAKKPSLAVRISASASAAVALLLAISDLRSGASMLSLFLGLGACLYFLLIATEKATPALSLAFGFCTILRMLVEVVRSYTDLLLPMNSPEKIWLHLAAVAGIFFLISEIRALVTKPYTATWFFASATATLLAGTASLTLLLGNLTHRFYGAPTKSAIVFAVLLLCFAVYTGARLFAVSSCPKPEETEEITEPEGIEAVEQKETEETKETKETEETEIFEETEQQQGERYERE